MFHVHALNRPIDLATALATLHAVFPHVWLYVVGNQGLMIACANSCPLAPDAAERPLLDTAGVERAIASAARAIGAAPRELLSTDDNLFLEYSTPRGNIRSYRSSLLGNLSWLRRFADP